MKPRRKIGARLGMVGYVSILRAIQRRPATTAQVCDAEIGSLNTARFLLRKMHAVKLIHVGAWQAREARCKGYTAVWHFGAGQDVPYPSGEVPKPSKRANNISSSMVAFAELMRALAEPTTKAELAERTGLSDETIRVVLEHASDIKMVRVAGWQPTEGDGYPAALWQLGYGPSPARPAPIPRIEIHRAESAKRRRARDAVRLQQAVLGMAALEAA